MKIRDKGVLVRFSVKEKETLKKNCAELCIPVEAYIRALVFETKIPVPPPLGKRELLDEINRIGTNINQIAKVANMSGRISETRLDELQDLLLQVWQKVKGL